MPRRSRSSFRSTAAKRMREARSLETSQERDARLEANRLRNSTARANESIERRSVRLQTMRQRNADSRASETSAQRIVRLDSMRLRNAVSNQRMHFVWNLAAFNYDNTCNYATHPDVLVGQMDKECTYCHALKFSTEPPGMCCANGKVRVPLIEEPPEPLRSYISGRTSASKDFLQNIRKYNSCFQMTSFGAKQISHGGFMPTFKIQGQIYHQIGSLLPIQDSSPKFLQIYFMDNENIEVDQRNRIVPGTKRPVIQDLQNLLHQHNELVKLFKTALEQMPTDEAKVVIKADRTPAGEHQRRFNAPVVSEMAVVLVDQQHDRRDIVIRRRNDTLQRVCETHRLYDALQYPLIFWKGEDGYHFNIMQINPSTGE